MMACTSPAAIDSDSPFKISLPPTATCKSLISSMFNRSLRHAVRLGECVDYFDLTNNCGVERIQFFRRNPVLFVQATTNNFAFVSFKMNCRDFEPCDIADPAILRVPVARDLNGVRFVRHGIEDRL